MSVQVAQLKAIHDKLLETAALMQARGKAMESLPSQYEGGDSNTDFLTTLNGLADSKLDSCRYGHHPCSQKVPAVPQGTQVASTLALRKHILTSLIYDTGDW